MKTTLCLLILITLFAFGCESKTPEMAEAERSDKIRVILDTDANNELDDQHAIAYMLFNGSTF